MHSTPTWQPADIARGLRTLGLGLTLVVAAMPGASIANGQAVPQAPKPPGFDNPGPDDLAADVMRREFLQQASPGEWRCYVDAKEHPAVLRQSFAKAFNAAWAIASATPVPDAFFLPSCAVPSKVTVGLGAVARTARDAVVNGVRGVFRSALQALAPAQLDLVTRALVTTGARAVSSADALPDYDVPRTTIAAAMIVAMQGEDAASAYRAAPPMEQARRLASAALDFTRHRPWPNVGMLGFADMGAGGSFPYSLANRFGAKDPDAMGWMSMSQRQRGEAVRRYYVSFWQDALDTANRARGADELAASWRITSLRNPAMVKAAFGADLTERYVAAKGDPAAHPDLKPEDVETAALILVGVVSHLPALLM